MKKVYYILLCLVAVSLSSIMAQEITRVEQVGKMIEIDCSISSFFDKAELQVSQDGGNTFSTSLKEVVFRDGTFIWDPIAEYGNLVGDNISFKVTVFPPKGMVYVEGGTFEMGSTDGDRDEKPVHSVTVSSFYIGKYEVTQAEWIAVMGNNPSKFSGVNNPVEQVSWYDCVEFCNAKSLAEGKEACYQIDGKKVTLLSGKNGYRLPTEAEWEFAARGGNQSQGYTYAGSNTIGDVAWYSKNASSTTHKVGTKQPNELGIYDMSGNAYEWCWDWRGSYPSTAQTNPTGATSGDFRVVRGGYCCISASGCRSSFRSRFSPTRNRDYDLGVRLVFVP